MIRAPARATSSATFTDRVARLADSPAPASTDWSRPLRSARPGSDPANHAVIEAELKRVEAALTTARDRPLTARPGDREAGQVLAAAGAGRLDLAEDLAVLAVPDEQDAVGAAGRDPRAVARGGDAEDVVARAAEGARDRRRCRGSRAGRACRPRRRPPRPCRGPSGRPSPACPRAGASAPARPSRSPRPSSRCRRRR